MSVVVDGELYALDPSSSLDTATMKKYDHEDDTWKAVEGDVPIRDFSDSESPYLLGGFVGKLHVITKDANRNISVIQAERQNDSTSLPSTSSTPKADSPNLARSETNVWKVISTRCAGPVELVNCQILDI